MNNIILSGAIFRNLRSGLVACEECKRSICYIKSGVKSFKIVFVCHCGNMGKVELNSPKKLFKVGSTAVMRGESLYCPICGAELATCDRGDCVNISFRVQCGCGAVYDKYKKLSDINSRLKEYEK